MFTLQFKAIQVDTSHVRVMVSVPVPEGNPHHKGHLNFSNEEWAALRKALPQTPGVNIVIK